MVKRCFNGPTEGITGTCEVMTLVLFSLGGYLAFLTIITRDKWRRHQTVISWLLLGDVSGMLEECDN